MGEPLVAAGDALGGSPSVPGLDLGATKAGTPGRSPGARRPGSPGRARSQSAGKSRSKSPLTPRSKKSSRQLKHELGGVILNMQRMIKRVEQAHIITSGTIREISRSATSARTSLAANQKTLSNPAASHNKPINEALTKLAESSETSVGELATHEASLVMHKGQLDEIVVDLQQHRQARDQQLKAVGTQEDGNFKLSDEPTNLAIALAGTREDAARAACMTALKHVRNAQSALASRKSAVQLSVRISRETLIKQARAKKSGKFGSSGERVTDPSSRQLPSAPDG